MCLLPVTYSTPMDQVPFIQSVPSMQPWSHDTVQITPHCLTHPRISGPATPIATLYS